MPNKRNAFYLILLLLACAGFVIYEYPLMHLPCYWDETFPYAYAVRHFVSHGITLLPSGMPEHLFTGHPPMFYFLEAVWMKYVADGVFGQRILPVILSVVCILMTFRIGKKHFNAETGLVAALLLATRAAFMAQASRVLPETMVICFMLIALELWLSRKFIWYVIPASLMLLTKEPSLTLIPLLCLWGLLREWEGGFQWKKQLRSAFFTCLPVLVASSFFVLQYLHYGWFFFPRHMQMSLPVDEVLERIWARCYEYFYRFGGFLLAAAVVVSLVVVIVKKVKPGREKTIAMSMMLLFVAGNFVFSSMNYYATARYVMFVLPVLVLLGAYLVTIAFPRHRWVALTIGFVMAAGQLAGNYIQEDGGDSNRGFSYRVKALQNAVNWCVANGINHKKVHAKFITYWSVADYPPGFVKYEDRFTNLTDVLTDDTEYYIHGEFDFTIDPKLDSMKHELVLWSEDGPPWIDQGPAWVSVFRIDHPADSVVVDSLVQDSAAVQPPDSGH